MDSCISALCLKVLTSLKQGSPMRRQAFSSYHLQPTMFTVAGVSCMGIEHFFFLKKLLLSKSILGNRNMLGERVKARNKRGR